MVSQSNTSTPTGVNNDSLLETAGGAKLEKLDEQIQQLSLQQQQQQPQQLSNNPTETQLQNGGEISGNKLTINELAPNLTERRVSKFLVKKVETNDLLNEARQDAAMKADAQMQKDAQMNSQMAVVQGEGQAQQSLNQQQQNNLSSQQSLDVSQKNDLLNQKSTNMIFNFNNRIKKGWRGRGTNIQF